MSSCGIFNINSRDATGIQALEGLALFQGLSPGKTLEVCHTSPSEEGWLMCPEAGDIPWADGFLQQEAASRELTGLSVPREPRRGQQRADAFQGRSRCYMLQASSTIRAPLQIALLL